MAEEISFKEKLKSIQWGTVPGGYRRSRPNNTYYDGEALKRDLLDADKEQEMEKTRGVGFMRRDEKGDFYRKDRITGDYIKAEPKDLERILGGGPTVGEGRRSFAVNGKQS